MIQRNQEKQDTEQTKMRKLMTIAKAGIPAIDKTYNIQ